MCLYFHLLKTRNSASSSEKKPNPNISCKLQKFAKLQFSVNSKTDTTQAEIYVD